MVINTAAYDRVAFALHLATAAAAAGQEVSLLFGYGGLVRLRKGSADLLGDETESWIREQLHSALERHAIVPISQLLETVLKLGARMYVCPAAMALHNLVRRELLEEASEVCSLGEFIGRAARGASVIYV